MSTCFFRGAVFDYPHSLVVKQCRQCKMWACECCTVSINASGILCRACQDGKLAPKAEQIAATMSRKRYDAFHLNEWAPGSNNVEAMFEQMQKDIEAATN